MTESNNSVAWTEVSNFTANTGTVHEGTFQEFAASLKTRVISKDVDELEFELMDAAERKRRKFAVPCIIPGATVDGRLLTESFTEYSMVSLDIDNGAPADLPDRLKRLGTAYVVYETVSSTAEDRRYRVWLPLAEPVPAGQYAAVARAVAGQLGVLDIVDPSGFAAAHKMSVPARWAFDEHDRVKKASTKRAPLDWRSLDLSGQANTASGSDEWYANTDELVTAMRNAANGERNNTLNRLAYILFDNGWDQEEGAVDRLVDAALEVGLPLKDIEPTIDSARRKGSQHFDERVAEAFDVVEGEIVDHTVGPDQREQLIAARVERMMIDQEARRRITEAEYVPIDWSQSGTLAEVLSKPVPPWLIEELLSYEGNLLISAMRKAGKTTTALNLSRSLITGHPFLGRFEIPEKLSGTVGYMNHEVSGHQLARWASAIGGMDKALRLYNLRGLASPLGTERGRYELAERLAADEVEALVVDPFSVAFTGQNANDAGEVRQWLAELDRCARGAGVRSIILLAHAGWNGDHARGSSSLEDWPDSIMTLTKTKEDRHFMKAIGRDVNVKEGETFMNENTLHLTFVDDSNKAAAAAENKTAELTEPILAIISEHPGINIKGVKEELRKMEIKFSDRLVPGLINELERYRMIIVNGNDRNKMLFPLGLRRVEDPLKARHARGARMT